MEEKKSSNSNQTQKSAQNLRLRSSDHMQAKCIRCISVSQSSCLLNKRSLWWGGYGLGFFNYFYFLLNSSGKLGSICKPVQVKHSSAGFQSLHLKPDLWFSQQIWQGNHLATVAGSETHEICIWKHKLEPFVLSPLDVISFHLLSINGLLGMWWFPPSTVQPASGDPRLVAFPQNT